MRVFQATSYAGFTLFAGQPQPLRQMTSARTAGQLGALQNKSVEAGKLRRSLETKPMITAHTSLTPGNGAPVYFGGRFSSPIGEMVAVVDHAGALTYLDFDDHNGPVEGPASGVGEGRWRDLPFVWEYGQVRHIEQQVMDYFAGKRRE